MFSCWWLGRWSSRAVANRLLLLLVAAFVLWVFGRIGADTAMLQAVQQVVVLGFVTSMGAAAAHVLI